MTEKLETKVNSFTDVEKAIIVINRELGGIHGELKWIKILVTAQLGFTFTLTAAVIIKFFT